MHSDALRVLSRRQLRVWISDNSKRASADEASVSRVKLEVSIYRTESYSSHVWLTSSCYSHFASSCRVNFDWPEMNSLQLSLYFCIHRRSESVSDLSTSYMYKCTRSSGTLSRSMISRDVSTRVAILSGFPSFSISAACYFFLANLQYWCATHASRDRSGSLVHSWKFSSWRRDALEGALIRSTASQERIVRPFRRRKSEKRFKERKRELREILLPIFRK